MFDMWMLVFINVVSVVWMVGVLFSMLQFGLVGVVGSSCSLMWVKLVLVVICICLGGGILSRVSVVSDRVCLFIKGFGIVVGEESQGVFICGN